MIWFALMAVGGFTIGLLAAIARNTAETAASSRRIEQRLNRIAEALEQKGPR